MNGLKFIRTRCNYSQAALAEELGVSRQAINMWECAKKPLSESRKNELKEFFGLETDEWFGEIDNDTIEKIKKLPMYKKNGEVSDHYHFSPQMESKIGKCRIFFSDGTSEEISLDERCTLKRSELKTLLSDIQQYSESLGSKNSHNRLGRMIRTQRAFSGLYDAMKIIDTKRAPEKVIYMETLFAIIDAINIAFGNISSEDFRNAASKSDKTENYNYFALTEQLSEIIYKHVTEYGDRVCEIAEKSRMETRKKYDLDTENSTQI